MTVRQGQQGSQTVPRHINYDVEAGALLLYPVAEISLLRQRRVYTKTATLSTYANGTVCHATRRTHDVSCMV